MPSQRLPVRGREFGGIVRHAGAGACSGFTKKKDIQEELICFWLLYRTIKNDENKRRMSKNVPVIEESVGKMRSL